MNIRKKISKTNEKIENIKEWQWLLITFFVCLVAIIFISPQIIWQPFIHAEDGPVFLRGALEMGASSLFKTFGGYFGVLPRGFAIISCPLERRREPRTLRRQRPFLSRKFVWGWLMYTPHPTLPPLVKGGRVAVAQTNFVNDRNLRNLITRIGLR